MKFNKEKIYNKNKNCFYCNDSLTYNESTIDHKVPRKNKGSNDESNLVVSCRKCNILKGSVFDVMHFKEIIKDTKTRDFYWCIRESIKKDIVRQSSKLIHQIYNYNNQYNQNKKHISRLKLVGLNSDKLNLSNQNIKKEIKKIIRKIYLDIEIETKKEIKKLHKLKMREQTNI